MDAVNQPFSPVVPTGEAVTAAIPSTMAVRSSVAGRRIHFVGIGGSGMSGLAMLARSMGAVVTGEDREASDLTDSLVASGVPVDLATLGSLPRDCDLLVASAAVPVDHPARQLAVARHLGVRSYAEFLGDLQRERTGISVAGTHGKSTTSSLLGYVLAHAGLDPSVVVGATCSQLGGGSRTGATTIPSGALAGQPGLFVAEACEYTNSFHRHSPRFGLVNNVEADHLDFFADLDAVIDAFAGFARRLPPAHEGGRLLIASQGAFADRVCAGAACECKTFGTDDAAHYRVSWSTATRTISVHEGSTEVLQWIPSLPGAHNRLNAAAAGILALWAGAARLAVEEGLATFAGVDRRMQRLGSFSTRDGGTAVVVDDYGHHPTECRLSLQALREHYQPKRLYCVFQPHQHSRTRFLLADFARSFRGADRVLLPDIYFVRDSESERQRVSARDLVDRIRALGGSAAYTAPFSLATSTLMDELRDGDLVVTMGAGPVFKVARALLAGNPADADN